jgi:hypothetical protein
VSNEEVKKGDMTISRASHEAVMTEEWLRTRLPFYRANRDPADRAVNSLILGTVAFHIETSISICNTRPCRSTCFLRRNVCQGRCRYSQKKCVEDVTVVAAAVRPRFIELVKGLTA